MKISYKGNKFKVHRVWCKSNHYFLDYPTTRKKSAVEGIVIHNTGNEGDDTAQANANYFKNQRGTWCGAHFIIDRKGTIYQCGRLTEVCCSVGGIKWNGTNPKYYGKLNNRNTVSIELCGIVTNKPTLQQLEATRAVIHYIKKHCKNAGLLVRHYDVNGKPCPKNYVDSKKWDGLKKSLAD